MKFRFEDEKQFVNQQNTKNSNEQSQITFQNDHSLMQKIQYEMQPSFLNNCSEIKQQLLQAVNRFKDDIDKEVKIQDLLKKQIQALNEKQNKILQNKRLSPEKRQEKNKEQIGKKEQNLSNQRKEKQMNEIPTAQDLKNSLNQQNKTLKVAVQNTVKSRSIKSQLLTKGYPVVAKSQPTKSNLPFRFRSN